MGKFNASESAVMSVNGSYAATLSPTSTATTDVFTSNPMSSSISSLSSNTSSRHTSHISRTYKQASTLFLTRRLPEALTTILPLVTPPGEANGLDEPAPVAKSSRTTRIKVWNLYLTILNAIVELGPQEGKDAFGRQEWRALCSKVREGGIWEEVVRNGYHGVEGDVDSEVIINLATLLLAHAQSQELNQKRLESYLAASNSPSLDLSTRFTESPSASPPVLNRCRSPVKGDASGAGTPRDLNARVKILELYTLHVLLRNNEWDYAKEFISVSSVLDEERREAFLQALQNLQEEQQESERLEQEERRKREERLQQDIEDARRLRAEYEERERRRLAGEQAWRDGSEVDYGIERTPSAAGPSKGRHVRTQSRPLTRPASPGPRASGSQPKTEGPVVPTFEARATMIMNHLRLMVEQLSRSLRANPIMLMRFVAFIIGLLLLFRWKNMRERIRQVLRASWSKVKATADMGVRVR